MAFFFFLPVVKVNVPQSLLLGSFVPLILLTILRYAICVQTWSYRCVFDFNSWMDSYFLYQKLESNAVFVLFAIAWVFSRNLKLSTSLPNLVFSSKKNLFLCIFYIAYSTIMLVKPEIKSFSLLFLFSTTLS